MRGLWVRFGAVDAVQGIDVAAHAGRATALLGRNGAGKSTTLRTVMGLWHASQGSVRFGGPAGQIAVMQRSLVDEHRSAT